MKLTPLGDKIVVERMEADEKTSGGIILPDSAKEKPKQGKVLAVGKGKTVDSGKKIALTVQKGDVVLFTSYAGTEVKMDGKEYLVMSEEDVLAIIQK